MITKNTMMAACVAGVMLGNASGQGYLGEVKFTMGETVEKTFQFRSNLHGSTGLPQNWTLPNAYYLGQDEAESDGSSKVGAYSSHFGDMGFTRGILSMPSTWTPTFRYSTGLPLPMRHWGWEGEAVGTYSGSPNVAAPQYGYNGTRRTYNNLARPIPGYGSTAGVDAMDEFPKPPLTEITVPAGATYVEFKGTATSPIPFASMLPVITGSGWQAKIQPGYLSNLLSSWFFFISYDWDTPSLHAYDIGVELPAIELLMPNGTTRVGVSPRSFKTLWKSPRTMFSSPFVQNAAGGVSTSGVMTVDTRIPLPANWAGGKLKFRYYPPVVSGIIELPGSMMFRAMLPSSGELSINTDVAALTGTLTVPPSALKEGFTGNIPIQFSVGAE